MRRLTVEWSSRNRLAVWLRFPARAACRNTRRSSQLRVSNIAAFHLFNLWNLFNLRKLLQFLFQARQVRTSATGLATIHVRLGALIVIAVRPQRIYETADPMLPCFKAAAVHAAPVFLDRHATTDKAIDIMREAAKAGAELIAFPETYIPAFPVWAALWAPIDNHDLFVRMADQSVLIDGPEVTRLRAEARALGVIVSIGISERSPVSAGGL